MRWGLFRACGDQAGWTRGRKLRLPRLDFRCGSQQKRKPRLANSASPEPARNGVAERALKQASTRNDDNQATLRLEVIDIEVSVPWAHVLSRFFQKGYDAHFGCSGLHAKETCTFDGEPHTLSVKGRPGVKPGVLGPCNSSLQ